MTARLLILAIVASIAVTTVSSATTIVVDWDGSGDYTLIQDGIDAASEGDTVLVMPGTYEGAGNRALNFPAIDLVLMSSGGARSVTIDCENADRGLFFNNPVTAACLVDGFTITNASASSAAGMYFFGCSPTIRNCILTRNVASNWGGGIYCTGSASPAFSDCTFSSNEANYGGGAACASGASPSFDGCTFSDNTSAEGGGGASLNSSSPSFTGCSFEGNSVTGGYTNGGGMYLAAGSSPTLFECSFDGNSAIYRGGAVGIYTNCEPSFTAVSFTNNTAESGAAVAIQGDIAPAFNTCLFYDNAATYVGGAVHSYAGAVPAFEDCTFGSNTAISDGGAMFFESLSTPELTNCTLYGNSAPDGSGIWCDDNFTLTNSIIAFGVVGEAVFCAGDPPYVTCSDIYGNAGGDWMGCLAGMDETDNNLHADPLFCDAPNRDFGIDVASPCTAPNAPDCGLVGAWDINCDSPVRAESWGAIKAMYR